MPKSTHIGDSNDEILQLESAIEFMPEGHPDKPNLLDKLGDSHPNKPLYLENLGYSLQTRFGRLGNLTDLNNAISHGEKAVNLTPDGHPGAAVHRRTLASALQSRFELLGNLEDLDSSISHSEREIELTPDSHPDKSVSLSELGLALHARFKRRGSLADIDNAIHHSEKAIELEPGGSPDKPKYLNDLVNLLRTRYERLGSDTDLDNAISHAERATELTPDGHRHKPMFLSTLENAFHLRFKRLGNLADLDRVISHGKRATELAPDVHPDKPMYLDNLGGAFQTRFELLDSMADLDSAVWHSERAIELTPDSDPSKPLYLENLGYSLQTRFGRLGSIADLNNAISRRERSIELTPDGHPDKPKYLNNLGNSFQTRFLRLGIIVDLDNAVSHGEKAVNLTPDGHPDMPAHLSNPAYALRLRFERLENLADLDSSISYSERAVELTPDGHPAKPKHLNTLGTALQMRFQRFGHLADLNDAAFHSEKAIELAPDGHPDNTAYLGTLGNALLKRFECLHIPEDLESALHNYSKAARLQTGPAMKRFKGARAWARAAEKHSRSPLSPYECAINLFPRIALLGLEVNDQQAFLADVEDIVRDAVAAAVQAEKHETAVEWEEQGRSIIWQNRLGLRTPLEGLRAAYPELANRLQIITRQLDPPSLAVASVETLVPAVDGTRKYPELAAEWEGIVEEIRRLPGFEGFLKPKRFFQLAPAACDGPIVVFNVQKLRCDALVLIPDESGDRHVSVACIPLHRLSDQKIKRLFQELQGILRSAGVRDRASRKHGWIETSIDHDSKFKALLRILWLDVVKPIMEVLAYRRRSSNPLRIWWCATGLLAFLPLHAAGIYDAGGEKVSDYAVSSYTPTLSAILDLETPMPPEDFQLLTVAQSQTPYATPIPMAEDEVDIVQRLARGLHVVSLKDENATVERVLQGMAESNWIHLACHAKQRVDDPMRSGFLLHDRTLQLSEIVKASLPKVDFAFLSGCQAAMEDEKLVEESGHLAAGMLFSGGRGVIASMWSIRDDAGPQIARDVYAKILKDGRPNRTQAAYALYEAVERLRNSGADFVTWVPFIHIGR